MLLTHIVQTSQRVAETPRRLEKISRLSTCLRNLAPEEIEIGVNYLVGRLRQGNTGIGPSMVAAAAPAGAAAEPTLTLLDVDRAFEQIARTTGAGSAGERRRLMGGLLTKATRDEQDFIARLTVGELRQGALEGILVEGIAQAAEVSPTDVRRAVMLNGDLATVAKAALIDGRSGLHRFALELLQPVQPMLAQPADNVAEALDQLSRGAFEYKMDGTRVQVHKVGRDVRVFTRTLNDVTSSVPEIVDAVLQVPAQQIVLDGETLAFREDDMPHPFQVTMRRFGRKLEVAEIRKTLPLTPFFFDCLHLDGKDLIDRPANERHESLQSALPPEWLTPRLITDKVSEAESFLQESLSRGHEGVMAKSVEAPYEAGRRGSAWLKIKRAHTLDLVVLAAEWGHGRRRGWLSNLHLGARDTDSGFVMLGKTFKGMTDDLLAWQTQKFKELEIGRDGITVYVRPELVVEIAFNDLQASPHYPGGLALRFARVKRYRPDKRADQADTIETVRALYAKQSHWLIS